MKYPKPEDNYSCEVICNNFMEVEERLTKVEESGGGGAKSWNDLDDRPFYTEDGEVTEVFPEATAVDASVATEFDTFVYSKDEEMCTVMSSVFVPIESGKTYTVKYNGVEYSCVAVYVEEDGTSINLLGDAYTMSGGMLGTEPTGEPFCLMFICDETMVSLSGVGMQGVPFDMPDSVTLAIYDGGEIIHKLDNKYLDLAWLPTKTKVNTVLYDDTISFSSDGRRHFEELFFEIKDGEKYTVTINEDSFETIGKKIMVQEGMVVCGIGNLALLDDELYESTGERFLIYYMSNSGYTMTYFNVSLAVASDVYISVVGPVDMVRKMPFEFLPSEISETYDFSDIIFENISAAQGAKEKNKRVTYNGNEVLYASYSDAYGIRLVYIDKTGIHFENNISTDKKSVLFAYEGIKNGQFLCASQSGYGVSVKGVDPYVLTSPNGTKYKITVDDSGNLTTTKV